MTATSLVQRGRPKLSGPTHCRHGHAYTPENTLMFRGAHVCRKCKADRNREYKQRAAENPDMIGMARMDETTANIRFVKALMRYGAKHGLPNLSGLQCITELRLLERIRLDDVDLASKIQREWG